MVTWCCSMAQHCRLGPWFDLELGVCLCGVSCCPHVCIVMADSLFSHVNIYNLLGQGTQIVISLIDLQL